MAKATQATTAQEKLNKPARPSVVLQQEDGIAAAFPAEGVFLGADSLGSQAEALQVLDVRQRQQAMNHIGRAQGNGHVQRLVAFLQREDETATTDESLDASGLGVEQTELPGHADQGGRFLIQREKGGGAAAPPAPTTTATINITVNPPTVDNSKTSAQISTAHGRPNVAGWTTPAYNITVPSLTATTINVAVTLDFTIEVASEYTGGALEVLRDHEQAHVIIGERVARRHMVTGLQNNLQGMATFRGNLAQIQTHINTASSSFVTDEATESQTYDTADYPRMTEAYLGARTSLSDLEAGSAQIAALTAAIYEFRTTVLTANDSSDEARILETAHTAIGARHALSANDLSRLQYNADFRAIVADCQHATDQADQSLIPESDAAHAVEELRLTLADFTWKPQP